MILDLYSKPWTDRKGGCLKPIWPILCGILKDVNLAYFHHLSLSGKNLGYQ